jgi:hypothetical protein
VGVYRQIIKGTSYLKPVYATADAVSLLPYGVALPAGLLPLMRVDGVDEKAAAELAGKIYPREKLLELVPESYGTFEGILTTDNLSDDQYQGIVESGDGLPVSVPRGQLARVTAEKAAEETDKKALKLTLTGTPQLPVETARQRMMDTRWDYLQPMRCPRVTAGFLVAEAQACVARGQLQEAGYSIGEALRIKIKEELLV